MQSRGVRVIVAGAGLAGLTAGARSRAAARRFASSKRAIASADASGPIAKRRSRRITPTSAASSSIATKGDAQAGKELDVGLVRVLRRGFGAALENRGRVRVFPTPQPFWGRCREILDPAAQAFEAAGRTVDVDGCGREIARRSLREMLEEAERSRGFRRRRRRCAGCIWPIRKISPRSSPSSRSSTADPGRVPMYRVEGGADRLVYALQEDARCRVDLRHVVRAVNRTTRRLRVTIGDERTARDREGRLSRLGRSRPAAARVDDHAGAVRPAAPGVRVAALRPGDQSRAAILDALVAPARPPASVRDEPADRRACGNRPRSSPRPRLLTLLAGGTASASLKAILSSDGAAGVTTRLRWLGGSMREKPGSSPRRGRTTPGRAAATPSSDPRSIPACAIPRPRRRPHPLRRRSHQPRFPGLHERRRRKRPARRGRDGQPRTPAKNSRRQPRQFLLTMYPHQNIFDLCTVTAKP